jgi:hypothetical protein
LHAALGDWQRAEETLEQFFREQAESQQQIYAYHSGACLLLGFLRERKRDYSGAREAWRRGLPKNFLEANKRASVVLESSLVGGMQLLHALILASLTNDLSGQEAEHVYAWIFTLLGRDPLLAGSVRQIGMTPAVIRDMWRSQVGREWARRFTFREMSFAEYVRVPVYLAAMEWLRQGASPEPIVLPEHGVGVIGLMVAPPQQGLPLAALAVLAPSDEPVVKEREAQIWELVKQVHEAFLVGNMSLLRFASYVKAWQDMHNPLVDVKPLITRLEPSLRGPGAYVGGLRYLHVIKQPNKAAELFRMAVECSAPDSNLHRLARDELLMLDAKR